MVPHHVQVLLVVRLWGSTLPAHRWGTYKETSYCIVERDFFKLKRVSCEYQFIWLSFRSSDHQSLWISLSTVGVNRHRRVIIEGDGPTVKAHSIHTEVSWMYFFWQKQKTLSIISTTMVTVWSWLKHSWPTGGKRDENIYRNVSQRRIIVGLIIGLTWLNLRPMYLCFCMYMHSSSMDMLLVSYFTQWNKCRILSWDEAKLEKYMMKPNLYRNLSKKGIRQCNRSLCTILCTIPWK